MASLFQFLEPFLEPFSMSLITILVITSLLTLPFLVLRKKKGNPPPSLPKLPIIGNLHRVGLLPHRSLASLARSHGPLALIHLGSVPVLIVSSSEAAREIMKTHDLVFASRPKSRVVERVLYNYKDVAMAPYGEHWRQVRSLCVLHLLSNKRVRSFRAVREQESTNMVNKIAQLSSSSSSNVVNLSEMFAVFPNNVVCRVALGKRYDGVDRGIDLPKLLVDMIELVGGFNVGDYIPWLGWVNHLTGLEAKIKRVSRDMDMFLNRVIEEHKDVEKKSNDEMDFVDILLWIQRDNIIGFPIDGETIKALILDMFGAGTHTSSTFLSWAMAELLRHPEVMKKLQDEVRGTGNGNQELTEDDLDKLPYLKAVIKETMRLHPPLPLLIVRESREDVKVMGYDIAAGTQVMINAWLIARDPATWERAEEFWPERFLDSSVDFKGHDFEFIPFGAGRRGCPGIGFAMEVVELGLAKVVQRFDWSLPGGARGEDLDMTEAFGLAIARKNPLLAIATPYIS